MKPPFVLGGLVSEAIGRSMLSYSQALQHYNIRVKEDLQPSFPILNLFNYEVQNGFLCAANLFYLCVTLVLFTYMKKRPNGYRLRWVLVIYDAVNVLLASYIAFRTLQYKIHHGGLLLCNPLMNDVEGYRISRVFLLFYLQKYFEFLDTWFFILRKSSRQVTFLHLFHHSSITVVVGSILPFDYNGDVYLPILLNSANHMMIYLHYLLATLGLRSWWAPYITSMQLAQFIVIFAQSLLSYRVGPTCGSPDFVKVLMIVYMGSMSALFVNFFLQKYVFRRPTAALDMCGVIKRPHLLLSNVPTQHCGTVVLDASGCCTVYLPEEFPDEERVGRETLRHTAFCTVYSLTAIGRPLPSLHVAREVGRASLAPAPTPKKKKRSSGGGGGGGGGTGVKGPRLTGARGDTTAAAPVQPEPVAVAVAVVAKSQMAKSFSLDNLPASSSKVVKSASFSDFERIDSPQRGMGRLHNDRLIDGPLPLQKTFDHYRKQISGITLPGLNSLRRNHSSLTDLDGHNTARSDASASIDEGAPGICNALSGDDRLDPPPGGGMGVPVQQGQQPVHSSLQGPLSFTIAGGLPGAKVSWMIQTIPVKHQEQQASTQVDVPPISTAPSLGGVQQEDSAAQDWRAIS